MKGANDGGWREGDCRRKFLELGKRAQNIGHRTAKNSTLVMVKGKGAPI